MTLAGGIPTRSATRSTARPHRPRTSGGRGASGGRGRPVGPYRFQEQVGEGGFRLVFIAEQAEPVRRKVALKVLKPGMGTPDVVARFEAERQAPAPIDHSNISRVFDAGSSGSGRPDFVMELIRGVPITDFCDRPTLAPGSG